MRVAHAGRPWFASEPFDNLVLDLGGKLSGGVFDVGIPATAPSVDRASSGQAGELKSALLSLDWSRMSPINWVSRCSLSSAMRTGRILRAPTSGQQRQEL